jgi:hypothetical protein
MLKQMLKQTNKKIIPFFINYPIAGQKLLDVFIKWLI